MEKRNPEDIAIVGMGCVFPGAPDLDAYWQNIASGVDAVTDPPADMWDVDVFYDRQATTNDRVYCKKGGFIGPHAHFDPLANGVMPLAVEGGEPDQWLALQVARAAFADAGYGDEIPERRRTAVILGKGTYVNRGNLSVLQHGAIVDQTLGILKRLHPEFTEADLRLVREDLKQGLPPFNADTAPGLIPNIIAGRIANRLDLMGPSYTLDAACASSLVALEAAVHGLRSGEFDLALVGGVHVATPAPVLMLFCQLGALSRQERIRPFDRSADGTILASGLGMVVLKRRGDAERDGHRIYAVVKGVGVASDGRGLSVMAPRPEGEMLALEKAYEGAGVSPRSVGLVEAHGTGTPVGDATEVAALSRVFGPRLGGEPWCGLGSVKSMIGHTMPAAGIAGLIKVALALHHKVLPPTLNVEQPNPELELEKTPFYINTETRPWIHGAGGEPRRGGVNAFGFGGINAHAILEEHPASEASAADGHPVRWETEVFVVGAESRAELMDKARRLRDFVSATPQVDLKDLAYSLNVPLTGGPVRLSVVAATAAELGQKLERAVERLSDPRCKKIKEVHGVYFFEEPLKPGRRMAFLFPGEGSQYVNMLADLCIHFPEVRKCFDVIDRVFASHSRNYVPSDYIFPRPAFSDGERAAAEKRLWEMEGAFEAVLTASWALFTLLTRLDIRPDALLGHSTGEYSAMRAAGVIDLSDEDRIARFANDLNRFYYQKLEGGGEVPRAALVAVGADAGTVSELAANGFGRLYVAMDNCPHQTVVVGSEDAATKLTEELRRRGLLYERLAFDRPYHTPLFEGYAEGLGAFFSRWVGAPPSVPLYSCTTRAPFPTDLAEIRDVAVQHWMRPVEFQKTIEAMYADGVGIFVEVGPRGNLSAFVEDILRGKPHLAIAADTQSRPGTTQLNHLVGLLAAQGVPMRLDELYARRSPRTLALDGKGDSDQGRAKRGRPMTLKVGWIPMELSEKTAIRLRSSLPSAAAPAPTAAPAISAPTPSAPSAPSAAPAPASSLMSSYYRTMEQFLEMQQDVMQAYLGAGGGVAARSDAPVAPVERPPAPAMAPMVPAVVVAPPAPATPVVAPPAPSAAPAPSAVSTAPAPSAPSASSITERLLKIVSDRTGYPPEMIDIDLDLEADLGIDSIKRVEILGSFQQQTGILGEHDMEALAGRKTLRQVSDFLSARASGGTVSPAAPAPAPSAPASPSPVAPSAATVVPAPAGPFMGRIVSHEPGRQLVALREIRLEEDRYLRDHTLGRNVSSTDPGLAGLPVMPLTMSMEILAEAAVALVPGRRLIGMKDVRAYRWLSLEGDSLTVKIAATVRPGSDGREVSVQVFEADGAAPSAGTPPIVEGVMVLGDVYPEAPAVGALALAQERPSKWTPDRLYEDIMFHGPAFRGVVTMDRWGADGAEATLRVMDAKALFASTTTPALVTDPVLMDQPGQVVGFWMPEHLETGAVVFPSHLEALHFYGPSPVPGEPLKCLARIALVGEQQVRSDLDVVDAGGRLRARFVGWWDRRFDVPKAFLRFLHAPREVVLSEAWPAPLGNLGGGFHAYRLALQSFPTAFFTAHGGVWQRALAHLVLSARERELWRALRTPEPRRLEWLLGRVAAKDALRVFLAERHGIHLSPADVEVLPDANGRPVPAGAWTSALPHVPVLSLSHSGGVVVAVVGDGTATAGVGVDLEQAGRLKDGAEELAFTSGEQALLAAVGDGRQESWPLRLWCAKEAVAKALGLGLVGGPRALVADRLDPVSGTVQLRLSGEMAVRFPAVDGRPLLAHTARERDVIVATSLYPRE
jgi:acyl transferase domain-containing protein/phosphopantetheinyl transferase/acyl carrier protein